MTNQSSQSFLIRSLETAASTRRRLLNLGAILMAFGVLVAIGMAAGVLDYAFHLPAWARAMLLMLALTATGWAWRRRKKPGATAPDRMAARLEVAFDHLHDRLVTAAEIATSSIRAPETISGRMIDSGADLIERIPYRKAVAPEMTWARLGRRLVPFAILAIAAVVSWEGVLRHAGRLFLPGAPIAPLTKTRLEISPGDTRIVKGDDIEIVLKTSGEIPAEAQIRFDRPGLEREEKMMTQISRGSFSAKVAQPADDFEYWIAAGDAVSFAYSIRVAAPPELLDPVFRIVPPAYTQLQPRSQPPGPVTAPAGSTIGIESQVKPDAASAVLVVKTGEERQNMSLGRGGAQISGSFSARESGAWAVQMTGEDGLSARAPWWPIAVVPDRKPAIRIRHPASDAMATPEETVPIVFSASDDYGLARVQLRIAWDSGPERIPQQRVYDGSVRETDGVLAISIEQLGLEPGDVLRYRIEALDANDVTGPGVSSTDLRFIEIVSADLKEMQADGAAAGNQSAARIRELIEMEKQVMRRTLRDVAAAPSPDAAEPVRRMQKSTREETDTTAAEIESMAEEDELSGAEALKESLTHASGAMHNAESSLQKCDGQNALSHEGAALTALNKALCSSCSNPSASGGGAGRRTRGTYSPSGPVVRRPGMSREGHERNRGGRRPSGSEERQNAQHAEDLAKALGRAAESMRQGAQGGGGVTPEMRDQLQQLLAQSEQMAGTRVPRAGRPAISATGDLIRQAIELSRQTYAPSGPIAKLLDDAARLMTETRETLLDAARRKETLMEERRRENVPDEYRELVRDYYRRLGS